MKERIPVGVVMENARRMRLQCLASQVALTVMYALLAVANALPEWRDPTADLSEKILLTVLRVVATACVALCVHQLRRGATLAGMAVSHASYAKGLYAMKVDGEYLEYEVPESSKKADADGKGGGDDGT